MWVLLAMLFSPVRVGPYAIAMVGFFANGTTLFSKVLKDISPFTAISENYIAAAEAFANKG